MSLNKPPKVKERTVAYPHRIFNKTSIYLLKTEKITTATFDGYEVNIAIGNITFKLQCKNKLSAYDGRIFDYILSRIQAIGLSNTKLIFFTSEILSELGQVYRTENRNKICTSLSNLLDVNIELKFDETTIELSLLESVTQVDGNFELEVTLSQSFIDAMDVSVAMTRYINISKTMKAKSQYSIELAKLLQIDGQGVNKNGEPISVKEITHSRICQYLSIEAMEKTVQITTLRKAFNELAKLGYKSYSYNGRKDTWQIQK